MARQLSQYHIWILDQLRGAPRGLTREQITEGFLRRFEERADLNRKVLNDYFRRIEQITGIRILCDKNYRYRIEDQTPLQKQNLQNWMLDTFSVSGMIENSQTLSTRILVEPIPQGTAYLSTVIEAMKRNVCLRMVYHKSYEQDDRELLLCPYCTRVFKQRWYVCGVIKEVEQERLRCYALDRVAAMDLTDIPFILPEDFDAATYFLDCYGIFDDEEPTDIYLKISALQRPWVRSLPIHSSQKIIKETDDFDIIRLHVRPCYDFLQQILTYGAQVQILKPDWLRYYFIADILEMTDLYHDIDDHLAEYEQYISESPEER